MSEIEVDDHAGNIMPRALGHLGIAEAECERLSLPKTLSKLTRGLRRNQNIIAA